MLSTRRGTATVSAFPGSVTGRPSLSSPLFRTQDDAPSFADMICIRRFAQTNMAMKLDRPTRRKFSWAGGRVMLEVAIP